MAKAVAIGRGKPGPEGMAGGGGEWGTGSGRGQLWDPQLQYTGSSQERRPTVDPSSGKSRETTDLGFQVAFLGFSLCLNF